MFKKLYFNILQLDLIESKALSVSTLLYPKLTIGPSRRLLSSILFILALSVGSVHLNKAFEKAPAIEYPFSASEMGLAHIYGPVPLKDQLQDNYRFYQANLKYGAFGSVDLFSIGEVSKQQFESLVLQNVPRNLRERMRPYVPLALGLSQDYQVDPFWVLAVMWTESHFNPHAQSHMNAQGLMQILPGTGAYIYDLLGRSSASVDREFIRIPKVNIEMGVFYLKRLINRFEGNYRYATAAYNMGTTRVIRRLNRGLPVGVNNLYLNKVTRAYNRLIVPFQNEVMSRVPSYMKSFAAYPRFKNNREVVLSSLLNFGVTKKVPFSLSLAPHPLEGSSGLLDSQALASR